MSNGVSARHPVVCTVCLEQGLPRVTSSANAGVGCALMFLFILPGLLYFLFNSGKLVVCRFCGSGDVVPLDSMRAEKMGVYQPRPEPPARKPARPLASWVLPAVGAGALLILVALFAYAFFMAAP